MAVLAGMEAAGIGFDPAKLQQRAWLRAGRAGDQLAVCLLLPCLHAWPSPAPAIRHPSRLPALPPTLLQRSTAWRGGCVRFPRSCAACCPPAHPCPTWPAPSRCRASPGVLCVACAATALVLNPTPPAPQSHASLPPSLYYHYRHGQVADMLYGTLGLPSPARTKRGRPSTRKEALEKLAGMHPAVALVCEHRKVRSGAPAFPQLCCGIWPLCRRSQQPISPLHHCRPPTPWSMHRSCWPSTEPKRQLPQQLRHPPRCRRGRASQGVAPASASPCCRPMRSRVRAVKGRKGLCAGAQPAQHAQHAIRLACLHTRLNDPLLCCRHHHSQGAWQWTTPTCNACPGRTSCCCAAAPRRGSAPPPPSPSPKGACTGECCVPWRGYCDVQAEHALPPGLLDCWREGPTPAWSCTPTPALLTWPSPAGGWTPTCAQRWWRAPAACC